MKILCFALTFTIYHLSQLLCKTCKDCNDTYHARKNKQFKCGGSKELLDTHQETDEELEELRIAFQDNEYRELKF